MTERGRSNWRLLLVLWSFLGACAGTPSHPAPATGSSAKAAAAPPGGGGSGGGGSAAPLPSAGSASELTVADAGDCSAICAKLVGCKHGPWDSEQDCRDACEAAVEDDTASRTYACAAKATSCATIKRCGK